MTHEEALQHVRGTLGQMIEDGEVPDEDDFNRIRAQYVDGAKSPEDRAEFELVTWDEAHEGLWE